MKVSPRFWRSFALGLMLAGLIIAILRLHKPEPPLEQRHQNAKEIIQDWKEHCDEIVLDGSIDQLRKRTQCEGIPEMDLCDTPAQDWDRLEAAGFADFSRCRGRVEI